MANPTIGATTPRIQYTATASQTVFTVPFEFLANADLAVYVNGTLKTLTTDYTLTGANTTGGGTLTFVTGRTAGEIITILSNLAYSRDTNKYTKYGLLPAEVLEADFDAMQVQAKQLALADQFAIRAPLTDTGSPAMTLPVVATRASKALGFDASGNPTVSASSLADIDSTVQIIDALNALPAGASSSISYQPAGTGAVTTTVQAKLREMVSVKDFGVTGDGTTDDTSAINAITSFPAYFPPGVYKISSDIAGLGKLFFSQGGVSFTSPYKVRSSVAFGIGALAKNTGYNPASPSLTDKNVAVGTFALNNNTTGYHNTAVGDEALFTNITGAQNTAVGLNALFYNTADNNTAVGTSALLNNSTGTNNTAVGRAAGLGNTTASSNTLIGRNVGWQKATGDNDTAVGFECFWDSTASGGSNSALGYRAGYHLTTGARNTAIGNESGYFTSTSNDVVAVGHRAAFNATGSSITAVGSLSLNALTTGLRNTAVGYSAGLAITTNNDSTFIGWNAGVAATGSSCTLIGSGASAGSGNSNTVVGVNSATGLTTGASNVILGSGCATTLANGSSNTVIGANATIPATGNNSQLHIVAGTTQLSIASGVIWKSGAGSPEAAVTAPVGSMYTRTDGGASTTLYVKESGTGNTGWVAK